MKPSEIQEIMNDDILSKEEKLELISDMLKFHTEISKHRIIRPEWKKKQDRSHEYHCESIEYNYPTNKMYYKSQNEINNLLREEYN